MKTVDVIEIIKQSDIEDLEILNSHYDNQLQLLANTNAGNTYRPRQVRLFKQITRRLIKQENK